MNKRSGASKDAADKLVRGIKRKTRKHYSAEEDQEAPQWGVYQTNGSSAPDASARSVLGSMGDTVHRTPDPFVDRRASH